MKKELTICIIVITSIIVLNIITQNYTNKVANEITENLLIAKQGIESKDNNKIIENVERANNTWEEKKNKLSLYIEHDELEKVEMYLTEIDTNIDTKEYNMAMQSLDTCIFIIDHIKDKYKMSLKNIF